ncbi:SAM-dependent methyltransferase [Acrocarpospora catenulata]|uniref:SAM-dependent methyltransferase n=1 Tax=Acrocarpospora catenulata TaxID=2836182 RepID=UPI001BD9E7C0|nr:SAM-dependent methyltransferase [Acrocarpospora catenulata]
MADRVPPGGVDSSTPNSARIYDFMLGGKDNFAADRAAATEILRAFPESREGCRVNRKFLGDVVRYMANEAGIRQFVDIGAGLPTQDNVHQVAQSVDPKAKVVYVDNDPVVCVHGRAILAAAPGVAMIEADMADAEKILIGATETGLIDWSQPVGVLMVAILHHLPNPYAEVARIREAMAPGSYLAISHLSMADSRRDDTTKLQSTYDSPRSVGLFPRTVEEITRFFGDFDLLDDTAFIAPSVLRRFAALGWGALARKP